MTTVAAPRRAPKPATADQLRTIEDAIREALASLPTVPTFCARCDQAWRLPIGIGGELCTPCRAAEMADRQIGRQTR